MTALDRVLPAPQLVEVDHVDVAASPEEAWKLLRHADFGQRSPWVRALFAIRTLTSDEKVELRIDDLRSSTEEPGFQVLSDDPPHEVVVGAIGKVWQTDIPFVHVNDAQAFAGFSEEGFVKVAWALRVLPRGDCDARVELEVRVDATDAESWKKFKAYFAVIGIGSRFIRHTLLSGLARELGTPESRERERPLPGDALLLDARASLTHGITIDRTPQEIWPWLLQMGCDRAGYYSIDLLDNEGHRSAREVHPDLQSVRVGDVLPARPGRKDGFEVLAVEPPYTLILSGLWDADQERQLPFASERPSKFWQITWVFVLEPLDDRSTRLHVRARAAFPQSGALHASWIRSIHGLMEIAQLRGLKARAEGTLARDDARDVLAGVGGAARVLFAFMTPFLRSSRSHWGVAPEVAARPYPGDDLVPSPRWSWTHGVEIEAAPAEVWPWIAQVGANKAGFYSYQWLENLAGCDLRNAETIHPEWEVAAGQPFMLHPKASLVVTAVERGRWFVVYGAPDEAAKKAGKPWVGASWLFHLEPLGADRSLLVSRYRATSSDDLATRLLAGEALMEPVGFAMDRRMLLGVKQLAERPRDAR